MNGGADPLAAASTEDLVRTRAVLHGVAECLMAGPQRRLVGRLRLRVTPGGFATTGAPAVRLDRGELVVGEVMRLPLRGTLGALAVAAGLDFGAPVGDYRDGSGASAQDPCDVHPGALAMVTSWFVLGEAALRVLDPNQTPVLWPEHFDVASVVTSGEASASVGCSPGDHHHPRPYAYVSTSTTDGSDFWNASFGALRTMDECRDIDALVDFWREGVSRMVG